ncbi:MAG: histidine kinase [Planctomycetes bacterium]|nr:histidine kinase [Planctomycetota bacterium]
MHGRIVARLTAPVVAVSTLLIGSALVSAWYVRDSQRTMSKILTSNVASVRAAHELESSLREIHIQFDRYLITLDRQHLERVPRLKSRTDDALAGAERAGDTEREQAVMKRVRQGYEHFFAEYDRLSLNPPSQGMYAKVVELIDTVLTKEILEPTAEYLKLNEGMLARATEANQNLSQQLTVGLIGLGVCGSIGGLLGGWVIAVSLRRSLLDTDRVLRDTAAQLGEAAHVSPLVPVASPTGTTLQQVKLAATAVLNRLKQTERDALRAEQLAWVGQMAAGIAHEVRNPLTVIKVLVQTATDPGRTSGLRPKDLQVLEGEILRLEQIISMFLDFARPPRPYKKPVFIGELLEECLAGINARANLQGVELLLDAAPELPMLDADPGQLKQVLYNLMFNALDVLPTGGMIRIGVSVVGKPDARMLTIQIADTGPGLPADLEDRIFEPFVSTKETGLGLGLSICRRIVEAHNGSIIAVNGPEKGAMFIVSLPCVPSMAAERNGALAHHGGA